MAIMMSSSNMVLPVATGARDSPSSSSASSNHSPRLLLSLVVLAGVASCFVFGEWQILSPFSRFLSTSGMDKAASNYIPSKLLKTVSDAIITNNKDEEEYSIGYYSKPKSSKRDKVKLVETKVKKGTKREKEKVKAKKKKVVQKSKAAESHDSAEENGKDDTKKAVKKSKVAESDDSAKENSKDDHDDTKKVVTKSKAAESDDSDEENAKDNKDDTKKVVAKSKAAESEDSAEEDSSDNMDVVKAKVEEETKSQKDNVKVDVIRTKVEKETVVEKTSSKVEEETVVEKTRSEPRDSSKQEDKENVKADEIKTKVEKEAVTTVEKASSKAREPSKEEKDNVKAAKEAETKVEEVTAEVKTTSNAIADEQQSGFDRIVLLGERHSGTTYTTRMLERCFPDIEVSDFLVRFKHWFQPTPDYVADTTKNYLKNDMTDDEGDDMFEIHNQWPNIAALNDPKTAFKRTLLIVMFRNPYDWLEAMRVGPHHWNNHFSMYRFPRAPVPETTGNPWYGSNFSTWSEFVNAEMTYKVDDGSEGIDLCQNGFMKDQVTPCLKSKSIYPQDVKKDYPDDINEAPDSLPFNAHHPIYEMDPEGNPYADPLAFRSAKIQNFLDIPNHWDLGSFMVLQHEDVNEKGSAFLLDEVSKILGQEPICEADPPKHQPNKILNPDWAKYITNNLDWETEGKVGYKARVDKPKEAVKAVAAPVKEKPSFERIVLLGERHSGTSYTTKMLKKCFPKLNVDDFFGRYKHWFQPTPEYMMDATKTFLQNPDTSEEAINSKLQKQWPEIMADPKAAFKNTVLIVMVRNPYDWVEALREGPHHWPNHFDTIRIKKGVYEIKAYDWNKFVSRDLKLSGDKSASAPLCQIGFPAGSVSPCLKSTEQYPSVVKEDYADDMSQAPHTLPFNSHNPIYEMDQNGKPFTHPLELRAAKINHFLDLPNHWDLGGFIKLQYEEMNMKGSAFLLEKVSKIVGMKPECQADPPRKQEHKELEKDWSDWITKHADWETEKVAGYEPRVSANSRQKTL